MMSRKLFIGGLAWRTDSATLADIFNEYGEVVEATVVTDRATGRPRGFGFVTFESESSAAVALQVMNGQEIDGSILRVDAAEERVGRVERRFRGRVERS